MGWRIEKKVKDILAGMKEQAAIGLRARKPTFVGAINTGRAFSHNMQGMMTSVLDSSSCPEVADALRTPNEFFDKYRALRMKVDMLQEENNRLRKMLKYFLTLNKGTPPPPKE